MTTPVESDQVYRVFAQDLRRFVGARVESANVDDVVQEVFLRVHRNIASLRDTDRVAGWVFQIARTTIVDHYRRRVISTSSLDSSEEADCADTYVLDALDQGDPQRLGAWLLATIELLPEPYSEALLLVERDGLSQREAAQRVGISVSGMKSRVQRGRRKLRRALERCCALELDRRGQLVDYHCSSCCA